MYPLTFTPAAEETVKVLSQAGVVVAPLLIKVCPAVPPIVGA